MGEGLPATPAASLPSFFSQLHSEQYRCSRSLLHKTGTIYISAGRDKKGGTTSP